MAIWTVTVLPENESAMFKDARDVAYVLPDGSALPAVSEPVWCGRCGCVTNGERIETADILDRMATHLRTPPSIHSDPLDEPDLMAHAVKWGRDRRLFNAYPRLTDLDRRRGWLSGRRSPPRCLSCGSTGVVPFPPSDDVSAMPHPHGHGLLRLHSPQLADYWGDWPAWLTPEGERAPRPMPPARRPWWPFGLR